MCNPHFGGDFMQNSVLLIDDSPIDRKIIRMTIEKRLDDVIVHELDNGFDVIEKIKELDISMCIVDIMMPEKDGFDVLTEIKDNNFLRDIPVIICTGIQESSAIEKALKLGAYDYFSKPLSDETLKIALPLKVKNAIQLMKRNNEIKHLSYHDVLTGSYSRRFYEEEIKRVDILDNLPLTVVMADINGLKLINDTFVHTIGDEVLKKAASIMRSNCSNRDIVARWGGDEFIILLPNTSASSAEEIIKKIQIELLNADVNNLDISVSFGFSTKLNSDVSIEKTLKNSEDFMYKNKMLVKESVRSQMVATMIKTLNEKNHREEMHSRRVSEICVMIGNQIKLNEFEINKLRIGGLLHDIGKIALEENVLNKPGKLTSSEWEKVQRHPSIGYRILSEVDDMRDLAELALSHHERWDGNGYPRGIRESEIPLLARIVAVADAYDAMTGERTYRKRLKCEEALEEIVKCSGSQFDPDIVEAFLNCKLSLYRSIS